MLLPKGIVENTAEVYAEVASYAVVPPEKIWEHWHGTSAILFPTYNLGGPPWLTRNAPLVYTITHRRLVDPTASRLENFWWHVWGSDRRYLSGHALAELYEEISTGPTFVPLQGPSNRYEGPLVSATPSAPPTKRMSLC